MPAFTTGGCTFTFASLSWDVTAISVESPTPEVVDMTPISKPTAGLVMVPTGAATSPGSITVDALGFADPNGLAGVRSTATFATPRGTISRTAICTSASVEARTGDLFRVRFTLMPTDYTA